MDDFSALHSRAAALVWLERLANITSDEMDAPFRQLPERSITQPAADFARKMLDANRLRLLALREELTWKHCF